MIAPARKAEGLMPDASKIMQATEPVDLTTTGD